MKKALKRAIAFIICISILTSVCVLGASAATETDCGGKCEHSPVIVLPGINHSPTYVYNENDEPVMYNGNHIGSTLLMLNEEALSANAIIKLVASVLATASAPVGTAFSPVAIIPLP